MLNHPAVNQFNTESGPRALIMEWLALWFDGKPHLIGTDTVTLPLCDPAWGESPPKKQPLENPEIRVVMHTRQELIEDEANIFFDGKRVTDQVLFNFWIAATTQGHGQRHYMAGEVAELLKALLTNPDTRYDLNLKGIFSIRPMPPQVIPSKDYAKRLVSCRAALQYGITFGDGVIPQPGGGAQTAAVLTVGFYRDLSFVTGEYFLGNCQWPVAMNALSANIIGWAPQGADAVVGLEVGGVLTGYTLTLAAGLPNVATRASVSLAGVSIAAGQTVRWMIVSGPSGVAGAWKASIGMNVTNA